MEKVSIALSSRNDTLYLSLYVDGNFKKDIHFDLTGLDERLTPEKMIDIWNKFKGSEFKIPLDRMVYYLYKNEYKPNQIISGDSIWKVLRLLYLLDKCSRIGKFDKFFEKGEQIRNIQSIKKWKTTEEKIKRQIIELDTAILSVISELEIASILTENGLDIEFIDKEGAITETGSRPDIKFIRNGLTADIMYATPYRSSPLTEDFITFETMIRDLLITLRKYADKHHLGKSDIIIIDSIDLYYQQQFLGCLSEVGETMIYGDIVFNILHIKDAMDKAFEIVKSCDNAMMLFFDGDKLSGGFRALVFPARYINYIKYEYPRRVYEIKNT